MAEKQTKGTLALFGATGNTGKEMLPLALKAGWKVKAFLRTPSKVADQENLVKFKGDLKDADSVAEFLKGCDAVMCLAGGPPGSKVGGPMDGFMVQSVDYIVKGMKQNSIRRIVLQNGGFTVLPGEAAPGCYVTCCIRDCIVGRCMGWALMISENQKIADLLAEESESIDWTLIRAGALGTGESKGKVLHASDANQKLTFVDIAAFELEVLEDDETIHKGPFPGYKGKNSAAAPAQVELK